MNNKPAQLGCKALHAKHASRSGFTLIELLVAASLILCIFSMVYGSYFATAKSTRAYKSKMAVSQKARQVIANMARQIRCSYAPEVQNPAKNNNSQEKTPSDADSFFRNSKKTKLNISNYFSGNHDELNGEILRLVTTAAYDNQHQAGGVFEATYKFDRQKGVLFYSQKKFVNTSKNIAENKNWQPLITNVEDIELEFFDGQRWLNKWDFNKKKELPYAVKINITCYDENDRRQNYGTIAYLNCRESRTNESSSDILSTSNKQ